MTKDEYVRECRFYRIIDSATLMLSIRAGFYVDLIHPIRLYGVNAPRGADGADTAKIRLAEQFIVNWFRQHDHDRIAAWPFYLQSQKADRQGRFLGRIECTQGHSLAEDMLAAGCVSKYTKGEKF